MQTSESSLPMRIVVCGLWFFTVVVEKITMSLGIMRYWGTVCLPIKKNTGE